MNNNLVYDINDRPGFGKTLVFAFQQLLAILAATIAVPSIVGNGMSQSAALFGAGIGTLVYLLFTKFKSPVFLGSSFAFIGSMSAAFAGGVSMSAGYLGLLIGALFAGLVYTIIAIIVKFVGVDWIRKLMPPEVIGPTVAIIGLSLAGNAVGDVLIGATSVNGTYVMNLTGSLSLVCALITLLTVVICSVYGNDTIKSIPFIIGILAGYIAATIFTVIGISTGNTAMQLIDFSKFKSMQWYPDFAFIEAFKGNYNFGSGGFWGFLGTIAVAYIPVSLVIFSEHLSDHQNLSSIIGRDLLKEPGLHRTLLGDGIGSIAGAFFGGACNTTYTLCVFIQ